MTEDELLREQAVTRSLILKSLDRIEKRLHGAEARLEQVRMDVVAIQSKAALLAGVVGIVASVGVTMAKALW